MKKIFILLSLIGATTGLAGPMVGGGPAGPQQQQATAFVNLGNVQGTGEPSASDVEGCNAGTSIEARAAKNLAARRAKDMSCLHGGHAAEVEVGPTNAVTTENFGWLCNASAVLHCY